MLTDEQRKAIEWCVLILRERKNPVADDFAETLRGMLFAASAAPAEGRNLLGQAEANLTTDFAWVGEQFMGMCSELGCTDDTNMLDWARSKIGCDTCNGTGRVCVGTSGRESDGNAPEFERCPSCGYGDSPAEGREPAAVMLLRLDEAIRDGRLTREEVIEALRADETAEWREAVDERAAFEAWARDEFKLRADGLTRRGDEYKYTGICDAWAGWQARAALATAPTKDDADFDANAGSTGDKEADRVINRLMSSDPDFDDCADAAHLIRRLVVARIADGKEIQAFATAPTMSEEAGEPLPYDGLTDEFADEVARLADDTPGVREAVHAALISCNAYIAPHPASEPLTDAARERNEWDKVLRFSKYIISRLDTTEVMQSPASGPAYDAAERAVFIRNIAAAEIERIDRAGAKKQDVGCLGCGETNTPAAYAANGRYICIVCAAGNHLTPIRK